MLDPAPPAYQARDQPPGEDAIAEEEVDVLLLSQPANQGFSVHITVIRLQYSPRGSLSLWRRSIITIGYVLAGLILAFLLRKLYVRLQLSFAKHRSLAGHSRMARRFASWVPFYEYGEADFFCVDSAPPEVVAKRRAGFNRLSALFAARFKQSIETTVALAASVSDLEFTSRYRVPFQFSRYVREHLTSGSFLKSSSGVTVTDLDGNRFYAVTGS